MPDALRCTASLVKISNKFDHISVGYTDSYVRQCSTKGQVQQKET